MPEELTPEEKLQKANDDYHEAANDAMMSEEYDIETKARLGALLTNIFSTMDKVNDVLNPPEEPGAP